MDIQGAGVSSIAPRRCCPVEWMPLFKGARARKRYSAPLPPFSGDDIQSQHVGERKLLPFGTFTEVSFRFDRPVVYTPRGDGDTNTGTGRE